MYRIICLKLVALALVGCGPPHSAHSQPTTPEVQALKPKVESYPNLDPGGRYVVYSSGEGFAMNLFRLDRETNEVLQLTDNEFEDSAASWSPDGRTIVFQRENDEGNRDIWVVSDDGSDEQNLTNTPGIREQHPRYSPDGARIVFDSNREETDESGGEDKIQNYEIFLMSADGEGLKRLTEWDRWDMYPSLSPAGGHLVWRRALPVDGSDEQNFDIFVKDLSTGAETNLTHDDGYDTNPHWSPSGDSIVFASNRTGAHELYLIRPDGTDIRKITDAGGASMGYGRPSFSFSGSQILANRFVRGVTDMVVIALRSELEQSDRGGR